MIKLNAFNFRAWYQPKKSGRQGNPQVTGAAAMQPCVVASQPYRAGCFKSDVHARLLAPTWPLSPSPPPPG